MIHNDQDPFQNPRPETGGLDIACKLCDFSIITYAVPVERIIPHLHHRFEPEVISTSNGQRALLSVVPFRDEDFTFAAFPFFRFTMQQTNYRVYVIDHETGERCVWFLGTVLDSPLVAVPRHLWKLPWHAGKIRFSMEINDGRYSRYRMKTRSAWAASALELRDFSDDEFSSETYEGFSDEEDAMLCLTHPMKGYYWRRDGLPGSYSIWHQSLEVRPAKLLRARFALLERLGILSKIEAQDPYSVLLDPENHFTIYLPPKRI